jgi:hypothetical protein
MPVEVAAHELDHPLWMVARPVRIARYWSGEDAPPERHTEARLLWSDEALCIRFVGRQGEPLVVSATPQTEHKTMGLWERDALEIFLTPEMDPSDRYFEFEAAPTGEWLDLSIHREPEGRVKEWQFNSGMSAAGRMAEAEVTVAMRIPWGSLPGRPKAGDGWRGNLFRCVGAVPNRGYLAWQPTKTVQPNFHVPEAFGWLQFLP